MKKRLFDIFFSFIGIIIMCPIFLIISILIKISSGYPILFRQDRVGRDGKIFSLIKFRTMDISRDSNMTITVQGDMRITKIGQFLRRYKLDELPELWNVFLGEMSFVGPRPDVPGYADKLVGRDRDILKLQPGITGQATLKYANEERILAEHDDPIRYNDEVIFPDKVRINLEYYDNQSIWLDIKIIFATIFRKYY